MRQRKYRTWDTVQKIMRYYPCGVVIGFNGSLQLMDWIGLKDKNGVEIYEGDIVRYKRNIEKTAQVHYDLSICAYLFGDDEVGDNLTDLEVVGNIHENRKFLEPVNA